jgi:predicted ATPase/DNA-binding SARP family transcriptional activator/Tfp pilus assembly protein PilF
MAVRLTLFGAPAADHGEAAMALPFERRSQLIAYLALKRAWVGRAELAALLWPEQPDRLAYANLRKTLFRLQSAPWAPPIEQQGSALRLQADTDVFCFESALREHRVVDALALRRGELLAGFDDDGNDAWSNWLGFERDRLRVAWRAAALDRLAADIDPSEGIELSARLLDADPLDEAALRLHMTWLARGGESGRARQAYREFAERMARDLGLAPNVELKALHDSVGGAAPPAPAAALPPDPYFIGRAAELRRIAELLERDDCRLLCLVGPGGVGKSRLARRVIPERESAYADGAAFVPLEGVGSASEVGGRLARELGVHLAGSADPLAQVAAFLHDRQMLLVLDNFEHLADEAWLLEDLLKSSRRLRILVTSRVRLPAASQWLLPLEGLPYPEPDDRDRIESFDAVRLFAQAARRVEPNFSATAEAAAIIDICRQLEGLPLALELAAAWTRVLDCAAIAAELRQGTELLRAVDESRPSRHASIEVVFDQSWRLLGAAERDALARLAVFRGGFTAEAARAVAGASLPVLGALADKSLLRKDGARLFMHPLVLQLAALRLGEGPPAEAARRQHANHFLRLLEQLRRDVENGERESLERIDAEFDNCRLAWRWAAAQGAAEALWRSTSTMSWYCDHRSRLEEGLELLRETHDSPAARGDPALEAMLLGRAAHLEYRLDRYMEAQATAGRGLELLQAARSDNADARVACVKVLGTSNLRLGRLDEARRHLEEALQMAPQVSDLRHPAAMRSILALVEKARGNYDEAQRLTAEALQDQRRLGDVASEALSLNNLAALLIERQQFEGAGEYLKTALALSDRHGFVLTRGYALANLIAVAEHAGEHEAAEAYARRTLEHALSTGNRFIASFARMQLVSFALRRRDLKTARAEMRSSMELATAIGRPALLIEGVARFGELLAAQGEAACGRAVITFARDQPAIAATERDELQRRLARLPPADGAPLPWPGLTFGELARRIVVETELAHAPLIAAIRGDGR